MDESVGTCGVSKASGIAKFDDLLIKETIFGATGADRDRSANSRWR